MIGHKREATVTDEIRFLYQTDKWQKPARLELKETSRQAGRVTVEARLLDAKDVPCLDARNRIRFGLVGNGALVDNTGTNRGSRVTELCNGRAEITLEQRGGKSVVGVYSEGIPTVFLTVT